MVSRIKKVALALAAIAALAFGGAQIAQGAGSTPAPTAAESTTAADTDNVQSGDQSTPDAADAPDTAAEAAGSEQPGNDGPGGHADEPSNPNANHQANGAE